jgi:GR25 family glycosyltransferase involved in LPS biosynthesis
VKTFCISCPETPYRTKAAVEHFNAIGLMPDVTFLPGIHARTFGLLTCHHYEIDHPGSGYMIPQKHVGLHLSHYMAWVACSTHSDSRFLILEDDALFDDDWMPRLTTALGATSEDADMLFVGSGNTQDKPKTHIRDNVYKVEWPHCTHAYVVYRKALNVLLETQRDSWAPIDLALIFRSFPKMNIYTVLPRLCRQRGQEIAP